MDRYRNYRLFPEAPLEPTYDAQEEYYWGKAESSLEAMAKEELIELAQEEGINSTDKGYAEYYTDKNNENLVVQFNRNKLIEALLPIMYKLLVEGGDNE